MIAREDDNMNHPKKDHGAGCIMIPILKKKRSLKAI